MNKATYLLTITALSASIALGDPPKQKHDTRNYIIRRQEAYQVQGTPTQRILSGGRTIDVYRDGSMFEKDHMVGVRR